MIGDQGLKGVYGWSGSGGEGGLNYIRARRV